MAISTAVSGGSPNGEPQNRLKRNSIGPWGLAALAIGITSPAMGLYGLWGPMQVAAGPITPLVFLASMLITLPTAISYASLNREAPSAGAASTWVWIAISPMAGYLAGFLMLTYFAMAAIAQPLMFALFFQDLLNWMHVAASPSLTLPLGILISTLPVAWVCLRGAEASIKSTMVLMLVETAVVLALSSTILLAKSTEPCHVTMAAFDPRHATSLSGFWTAMILGVLAFCGFDVVSTAAEEAHAPKEHVPKAILLTIIGMAIFWALNAWVFTLSTPPSSVRNYTAHGLTAITPVAQAYWGMGSVVIILTAFTGLTAVYISSVQGTSRIVFAMARLGLLPTALSRLAGERRVPRVAVWTVLIAVPALDWGSLALLHNGLDSFTWWASALVFFATLTFFAVNLANCIYFWRFARGRFRLLENLLVPALGALANAYLIYAAFFATLWSGEWRNGRSVVLICIALLVVQVGAVISLRALRPRLFLQGMPLGLGTGDRSCEAPSF